MVAGARIEITGDGGVRLQNSSTYHYTRIGKFYFWVGKIEAHTETYRQYEEGALEILTPPEIKKPAEL